jgi:UDP-N-acetyl-alpha-D-muramoyl-L-alanyl-L-glutamate epimerase
VSSDVFSYRGHELGQAGVLTCRYSTGGRDFLERFEFGPGEWTSTAALEAARLVYLLAGVSYYKTAAPGGVALDIALRPAERSLLSDFYRHGLAEFAYANNLDLGGLTFGAEVSDAPPAGEHPAGDRPLVPFGGGIDSIVTAEETKRRHPEASLFVVSPASGRFEAIERVIPVTGLPVVRVTRQLDPQVLQPAAETGFLQGHVPATGVVMALGVLAAVGTGHDAVVLANEWSASVPTVVAGGTAVNHQYSKGWEFEEAFRAAVMGALGASPRVFSLLRPYSELWVAERFAALPAYHRSFHSCNRAFAVDPARRLDHWCGECDKCCFVDLILAPFLAKAELEAVFDGREPLGRPELAERFETLVGLSAHPKPFECVGEVGECRAAVVLAAGRGDRQRDHLLTDLAARLPAIGPDQLALLRAAHQPHEVPGDFTPEDLLV